MDTSFLRAGAESAEAFDGGDFVEGKVELEGGDAKARIGFAGPDDHFEKAGKWMFEVAEENTDLATDGNAELSFEFCAMGQDFRAPVGVTGVGTEKREVRLLGHVSMQIEMRMQRPRRFGIGEDDSD